MRIILFYHSLISDWNHGNAHFLRGIATELLSRGHEVEVYEPKDGWSLTNLMQDKGEIALRQFRKVYPQLRSNFFDDLRPDLDSMLEGADLVIVHEWNSHELIGRIGEHRKKKGEYRLLFHDTHHRSVTDAEGIASCDLSNYDGVLAYGSKIREIYLASGWAEKVWVWHEAADTAVFFPRKVAKREGDVIWIGNWGDDERSEEICRFFVEPVKRLGLKGMVYGVRYPEHALAMLAAAGIRYGGWLPNFQVPEIFSRYAVTMHIPRRPYATVLPGIPTIRPFEALACGIPLLSAPWEDSDHLFTPGRDFLFAHDRMEMEDLLDFVLTHPGRGEEMAAHGLETVMTRHTCRHRVDELMEICAGLGLDPGQKPPETLQRKGLP